MVKGLNPEDKAVLEKRTYPRIMFAAPESGSGKTIITCGFLEILKKRGIDAVSFKCGPDYIDPLIHSAVTGIPAINLDSFFLDHDEVISLFERKADVKDIEPISVIEGVMGYYDGLAGTSFTASSYDIADCLDCPVVIILDMGTGDTPPEKQLKELLDRVSESHIKGVILNRTTPDKAKELRFKITSLGVGFYGYVPECDEAKIESRHLGLEIPADDEKFLRKISAFSDIIEETIDTDGLIKLACDAPDLPQRLPDSVYAYESGDVSSPGKHDIHKKYGNNTLKISDKISDSISFNISGHDRSLGTIAVARDEAFCFQYEDNLDFLGELGYELKTFSPLHDKALPEDLSAILLCGGYPEVYARELSANEYMLNAIRQAFGKVKIMAECGGFLYLHESLEGSDGIVYPMAACIEAKAFRTGRSSRFGYISLYAAREAVQESIMQAQESRKGDTLIKAHEFHYWDSTAPGTDLLAVKPVSGRSWECCYLEPYLLAGFPHLYYRSGPEFIYSFLSGEATLC